MRHALCLYLNLCSTTFDFCAFCVDGVWGGFHLSVYKCKYFNSNG